MSHARVRIRTRPHSGLAAVLPAICLAAAGFPSGTALGAPAGPAPVARLARLVGADTELYISVAAPDRIAEILDGSGLGRLARLPGFAKALERPLGELRTKLAQIDQGLAMAAQTSLAELRSLLHGPISVAVSKLPPPGAKGEPEAVFAVDVGPDADVARDLVTRMGDFFATYMPQIGVRASARGGVEVTSFSERVHVAVRDGLCLVGAGWEPFARALDRLAAGPEGSLAARPSFRRACDRVLDGELVAFAFLRLDRLLADPRGIDAGGRAFLRATGLDHARALSASLLGRETELAGRLWIDAADRRGLLRVLGAPLPSAPAPSLAARPAVFASLGIDAAAIWQALEGIAGGDPRQAGGPGLGAAMLAVTGVSIEEDLLPAVGRSLSVAVSLPAPGAIFPDVVAGLAIERPEPVGRFVEGLLESRGIRPLRSEYGGTAIHTVPIPGPVAPCYAFVEGRLLAATSPSGLRGAIDAARAGADLPAAVRAVLASAPEGASAASFIDLPAVTAYLRRAVLPWAAAALRPAEPKVDLLALPGPEPIASCLGPYRGFIRSEDEGILVGSSSAIGPMALAGFGTAAVLGPEIQEAKRQRLERACRGQLEPAAAAIRGAETAALEDLAGKSGAELVAALRRRLAAAGVETALRCPAAPDGAYEGTPVPFDPACGPATPILWDAEGGHAKGRFVLFRGGFVAWMREASFAEMLRRVRRDEWSVQALIRTFEEAYASP